MIGTIAHPPELSVVIVAGLERARAQRAIEAVGTQSVAAAIDLVIVDLEPELTPLMPPAQCGSAAVHSIRGESSWSAARYAGVVAASSPVVAFVEDHVYVEPGWAEALLEAYRAEPDAVAVGYAFANADEGAYATDAALLAEYGRWLVPARGGRWDALPGNNVSYRRDALLGLGDLAANGLAVDFALHGALRRRGFFVVAPRAVVRHEGFPGLRDAFRANHEYGRALAASRCRLERWSGARRALYAIGATPVVPVLQALRLAGTLCGRGRWGDAIRLAPGCLSLWVAAAAGEAVGYATGSGGDGARLRRWETDVARRMG